MSGKRVQGSSTHVESPSRKKSALKIRQLFA